jgi:alpha-galactosidase
MAMNVGYLAKAAPEQKVAGLCHSVFWTIHDLSELVGVPHEEVTWTSAGVNHQAWVLSMEHHGQDLYPLLDARIREDPELRRRVRVDMYRRLGYYPTETSEHSSEYVPWYLHDDGEVERLRLAVGAYIGISEENVRVFEATKATLAAGEDVAVESGAAEYAPQVIHSIVTGRMRRIHGNVANHGLISNLPEGYAVEVPCVVDHLGVRPERVGALPPQCAAVNRSFVSVGQLTVAAAVEDDPLMVRRAAMVDPNTAATLPLDAIWALCDEMTEAHRDLLPESLRAPV